MIISIVFDAFASIIFYFLIKRYLNGDVKDNYNYALLIKLFRAIILLAMYFIAIGGLKIDISYFLYINSTNLHIGIIFLCVKMHYKKQWKIIVFISEEKEYEYKTLKLREIMSRKHDDAG